MQRCEDKGYKDLRKNGQHQNPHGATHAWYMGFAPYDNPRIVVVALVENSGLGSEYAAPVAGQLFARYFRREVTTDKTSVAYNNNQSN